MAEHMAVIARGNTLRDRLRSKADDQEYDATSDYFRRHSLMIAITIEDFTHRPRYGNASPAYDVPEREIGEALDLEGRTDPANTASIDRLFGANVEARYALKNVTRP